MEEARLPYLGASLAGRILVSRPDLRDPRFDAALTLILEHGSEGALGVIINRPSATSMYDVFPDWEELAAGPDVLFTGGPVDRDALIALGKPSSRGGDGHLVLGAHAVDLDHQPALVAADGIAAVRVFAGYAGWSVGQLENEIANDAWWVVEATIDDLFTDDPAGLWSRVLRRQGGELAWFAHYPHDPSLN